MMELLDLLKVAGGVLAIGGVGFLLNNYLSNQISRLMELNFAVQKREIDRISVSVQKDTENLTKLQSELQVIRQISSERAATITILTLESLPAISLTQQIPANLLKNLSFVLRAELREGLGLDRALLSDRNSRELYGWIAYATAIQRLAMNPMDTLALQEGSNSALALLQEAQEVFAQDVGINRAIRLREVQCLRQVHRFQEARGIIQDLRQSPLGSGGAAVNESSMQIDLAGALVNLQEAITYCSKSNDKIVEAIEMLKPHFSRLYGWKSLGQPLRLGAPGDRGAYGGKFADGSIAFYMAKALWLAHIRGVLVDEDMLREALDVAFDRYERVRRTEEDPSVSAIYNFCVALIIAMRSSCNSDVLLDFYPSRQLGLEYEQLTSADSWDDWAQQCLKNSSSLIQRVRARPLPSVGKALEYFYSESVECLDRLAHFQADIEAVRAYRKDPEGFRRRFSGIWNH